MLFVIFTPGTLGLALADAFRPDGTNDGRTAVLVDREGRGAFRVRTHMACLVADGDIATDETHLSELVQGLVDFARETGRVPVVRGVRGRELDVYAALGLRPDPTPCLEPDARYTVWPGGLSGVWARLVTSTRVLGRSESERDARPIRVPLQAARK